MTEYFAHAHNLLGGMDLLEEKPTEDDLSTLVNDLDSIASKWEEFGLQLPGMKKSKLDSLKHLYLSDTKALREVLALWLRNGSNLTRKAILDALRSESVGESQLAGELYKQYTTTSNKVSMMGGAGAEISWQAGVGKVGTTPGPRGEGSMQKVVA